MTQTVFKVVRYHMGMAGDARSILDWNLWETEYPFNEWVDFTYPSLAFDTLPNATAFICSLATRRLAIYEAKAEDVTPVYSLLNAQYLDRPGAVEWFWEPDRIVKPAYLHLRQVTMSPPTGTVGCKRIKLVRKITQEELEEIDYA